MTFFPQLSQIFKRKILVQTMIFQPNISPIKHLMDKKTPVGSILEIKDCVFTQRSIEHGAHFYTQYINIIVMGSVHRLQANVPCNSFRV